MTRRWFSRSVGAALVRHPIWTIGMLFRSWRRRYEDARMKKWREDTLRRWADSMGDSK